MKFVFGLALILFSVASQNVQAGVSVTLPDVRVQCSDIDPHNGAVDVYVSTYYRGNSGGTGTYVSVFRKSDNAVVYRRQSGDYLSESGTGSIRFWSPSSNAWYQYNLLYGVRGLVNNVSVNGIYSFTMNCELLR